MRGGGASEREGSASPVTVIISNFQFNSQRRGFYFMEIGVFAGGGSASPHTGAHALWSVRQKLNFLHFNN